MAVIRKAILDILGADNPQTVRQTFYAATVVGVVEKEEREYKGTVDRLLVEMREDGTIPFEWIADNTRWQRKPSTFVGLEHCLNSCAELYRRDLWAAMPVYVEVWCEKDALAGVLYEETKVYDVPLKRKSVSLCLRDIGDSHRAGGAPARHDPTGRCPPLDPRQLYRPR
jgi:hypothetical protein